MAEYGLQAPSNSYMESSGYSQVWKIWNILRNYEAVTIIVFSPTHWLGVVEIQFHSFRIFRKIEDALGLKTNFCWSDVISFSACARLEKVYRRVQV